MKSIILAAACMCLCANNTDATISESPEDVESIRWSVRTGENYNVWIRDLGPRASNFTVEHFIERTSMTSTAPAVSVASVASGDGPSDANGAATRLPAGSWPTMLEKSPSGAWFAKIGGGQ